MRQALLGGTSVNLPVKLPSHSQSVERTVKLVTEASKRVYGFEQRHKHIHSALLTRMSEFQKGGGCRSHKKGTTIGNVDGIIQD